MNNGTKILPQNLQHRSPTMKAICVAMSQLPKGARNPTRVEVMEAAHRACGKETPFYPTFGGCYWRQFGSHQEKNSSGHRHHDEAHYSVILNGLVRVAGKRGRRLTYELTPAGELFAHS